MSGIDAIVADHLEVLFRDVLHEKGSELKNGDGLFDVGIVLVTVVVKCDSAGLRIIFIDPFGSNDRPAKVTADVLGECLHIGEGGLGVDIESLVMYPVHPAFDLFVTFVTGHPMLMSMISTFVFSETFMKKIQKDSTEGVAEVSIVEMADVAPGAVVGDPPF